jgi:nicotinamide-nucleotide amidase
MPLSPERAAVITVGDELLQGRTRDANLMEISRALSARGIPVGEARTVPDTREAISAAALDLLEEGCLVVTTGGLGPTDDDITLASMARALGLPLERNRCAEEMVRARMDTLGRECPPSALRQADLPRGAEPVENRVGVAPGVVLELPHSALVCLPGVPAEVRGLLEGCLEALGVRGSGRESYTLLRTWGIRENDLYDTLSPLAEDLGCRLAFLPSACRVDVRVFGPGREEMARRVDREYPGHVYSRRPEVSLAGRLGGELGSQGISLAVAESCTGGMLGGELTSVPGASDWFAGGVISYSNRVKREILGVEEQALERHGAVSRQVVREMADGVAGLLGADAAMAVSGIAGPSGGTSEKPVGTVWMATTHPGGGRERRERFGGDREHVRRSAVSYVMGMLLQALSEGGS